MDGNAGRHRRLAKGIPRPMRIQVNRIIRLVKNLSRSILNSFIASSMVATIIAAWCWSNPASCNRFLASSLFTLATE